MGIVTKLVNRFTNFVCNLYVYYRVPNRLKTAPFLMALNSVESKYLNCILILCYHSWPDLLSGLLSSGIYGLG
jgi:hypothetical protein